MRFSSNISLATAFIELFFYSGTVFGFSFLEYIWKEELIFFNEKCTAQDDPNELCEDAVTFYNTIFTCTVISTVRLITSGLVSFPV